MTTITVILEGHEERAAVSGMLRHFFSDVRAAGPSAFRAVFQEDPDARQTEAVTIRSTCDPSVAPEEARRASRTGAYRDRAVLVRTAVQTPSSAGESDQADTVPLPELRETIRRQLFNALSSLTGAVFPWGMLTGVRPTEIALRELRNARAEKDDGDADARAAERLVTHWKTSPEKAALAVETAKNEDAMLRAVDPSRGDAIVYVGLPFCPSRCAYCSFITQDATRREKVLPDYVDAVIREAEALFSKDHPIGLHPFADPSFRGRVAAVYFGGGTPTSLPAPLLRRYVDGVLSVIPIDGETELTIEAGRPDTLDEEKLALLYEAGFGRLCINPQSMHDVTLQRIGRRHTVADVDQALRLARQAGFRDINMDLIAGLPGEDGDALLDSLRAVLALQPESITLHTLAIKKGSFLDREFRASDPFRHDPALEDAVRRAHDLLRAAGYHPYYLYRQKNCRGGLENTGFVRPGFASLYNVAMMSDKVAVIGLGSGSSSKKLFEKTVKRFHNPKDIDLYIRELDDLIARKRCFFQ